MHRRRFLATGLTATSSGLAGCLGDCGVGETWQGVGARIADPVAQSIDDGGWRFEATLVVAFRFARSSDLALRDAGLRLWGPDRRPIATERVGDVAWRDVAAANRTTTDCDHTHGETRRRVAATTDAFPAWLRPVGRPTHHTEGLDARRYDGAPPARAAGPVTDYVPAGYVAGQFPPIDDTAAAVAAGDGVEAIDFRVRDCTDEPRWSLSLRRWAGDGAQHGSGSVEIRGYRRVADPCQRPLLRSVGLAEDGGVVEATIGLHRVDRADCPARCAHRRYDLRVHTAGPPPRSARVTEVDAAGAVVDRHRVDPLDG